MEKTTSCKIARCSYVFTLVIVAYHANIVISDLFTTEVIKEIVANLWEMLANVAMSYFFMSTGFLFYRGLDQNTVLSKLRRRCKTIILPFFVWNLIYYAFSVLQHGFRDDCLTVLYRFSFDPYDGPLWYLFAITVLSLFSLVVIKIKDSFGFRFVLIGVCIVSAVIYSLHIFTLNNTAHFCSWIERLFRYIPSYIYGAAVAIYGCNAKLHDLYHSSLVRIISVVLVVLWAIFGAFVPDIYKMITLFFTPLVIWNWISPVTEIKKWMRNSFIIYASHRMVLTCVSIILLNKMGGGTSVLKGGIANIVALLFPFCICIFVWCISDVFVRALRKFHLDCVLVALTGGRT